MSPTPSEIRQGAERAAVRSRGVLGPLFAILTVLSAQLFDVRLSGEELSAVTDGVSDLIVAGGVVAASLVGIYGRIRASGPVTRLFG